MYVSYLLKVLLPVISEIMKQGCFQSYASLHPQGPRWQVVSTHAKRQSVFTEEMIQDQVRGKKTIHLSFDLSSNQTSS